MKLPAMSDGSMTPLARELKRRMEAVGWRPRRLSMLAGLGPTYVRDIIRGHVISPSFANLTRLATTLGCTPQDLTGTGNKTGEAQSERDSNRMRTALELADKATGSVHDRAGVAFRVARIIYDIMEEREREGHPITPASESEWTLLEAMVRRIILDM